MDFASKYGRVFMRFLILLFLFAAIPRAQDTCAKLSGCLCAELSASQDSDFLPITIYTEIPPKLDSLGRPIFEAFWDSLDKWKDTLFLTHDLRDLKDTSVHLTPSTVTRGTEYRVQARKIEIPAIAGHSFVVRLDYFGKLIDGFCGQLLTVLDSNAFIKVNICLRMTYNISDSAYWIEHAKWIDTLFTLYDLRDVEDSNVRLTASSYPPDFVYRVQVRKADIDRILEHDFVITIEPYFKPEPLPVVEKTVAGNERVEMTVSPNPFNPTNSISYNLRLNRPGTIKIFDISGKMVFERVIEGLGTVMWDASGLGSGVYVLKVLSAGKARSRKLVLQR